MFELWFQVYNSSYLSQPSTPTPSLTLAFSLKMVPFSLYTCLLETTDQGFVSNMGLQVALLGTQEQPGL